MDNYMSNRTVYALNKYNEACAAYGIDPLALNAAVTTGKLVCTMFTCDSAEGSLDEDKVAKFATACGFKKEANLGRLAPEIFKDKYCYAMEGTEREICEKLQRAIDKAPSRRIG